MKRTALILPLLAALSTFACGVVDDEPMPAEMPIEMQGDAGVTGAVPSESFDGSVGDAGDDALAKPIVEIPATIANAATCDASMPDVTNAIQSWIDSVPNGSVARFAKGRCYRLEGSLKIVGRRDFVVDGNGATLQAFTDGCDDQTPGDGIDYNSCRFTHGPARNRSRVFIDDTLRVTIRNFRLEGGNVVAGPDGEYVAELEGQHAFDIRDNDGLLIEENRADRVFGDFVYVSSAKTTCSQLFCVLVRKNVFGEDNGASSGNGRQGLAVVNGTNVVVENNRFSNIRRSGVDVEANSANAVIRNVFIRKNVFANMRLNFFSNWGADCIIDGVHVNENVLQGRAFAVDSNAAVVPNPSQVSTFRRKNYEFIGNVSTTEGGNPSGRLARISGVSGVTVQGNRTVVTPGRTPAMVFLSIENSRSVRVVDNTTLDAVQTVRYENSVSVCERANRVGSPLVADPRASKTICP